MEQRRTLPLAVVGVSHRTAPVEVRERMAFGAEEAERALLQLRDTGGVEEAVLLSTCNRSEFYLFPSADRRGLAAAEAIFLERAGELDRPTTEFLFRRHGEGVVRHLFQVSCGLDSLVTGEAEIQGQVRDAYERATLLPVQPPMAGPVLNRLFQMALSVGGEVRAETPIGEGAASVASVAVELARKIFGSLRGKRVLIMGAGATAELMVEALARDGVRGIFVANRTLEHAVPLAERLHGHALSMDRLGDALPAVDIILSSTSAPHPVLTHGIFREAFPRGRRRPLLAIDIAIPRDIDPRIGDESEVFLYNVDDLRKIVDDHVRVRAGAVPAAERIIQRHSEEFRSWYASLEVVPVIRNMRERAESHRQSEVDRLFRGLDHISPEDRARVEAFSRRLLNKFLHDPTVRLRKGMLEGGGAELVDAVRFLYGVEGGAERGENPESSLGVEAAPDIDDIPRHSPDHTSPSSPGPMPGKDPYKAKETE
ncbi:glutamyl-tRNA reductase [soil metagenome]